MGISAAVTRFNTATATGTQDVTISGFGTPKAALFVAVRADVSGTADAHAAMSIGFTDGTSQVVSGIFMQDNLSLTDDWRHGATDEVIQLRNTSGIDGEANFDSWITDGVRINWGVAPDDDWLVTVTLFGGTDLSAKVGTYTQPAGDTNTVTVDTGFEPDVVFNIGNGASFGTDGSGTAVLWFGAASNQATIEQACVAFSSTDNTSTSQVSTRLADDRIAINQRGGQTTTSRAAELTAFAASPNSFTCTTRDTSDSFTFGCAYLALEFNGAVDHSVDIITTPTSTGNASVTAPGFEPQLVIQAQTYLTGVTVDAGSNGGSFAVGIFDATNEYSGTLAYEDNVATSNAQSTGRAAAVDVDLDSGGAALDATFVSMDASGWTLNYSAVSGTARKFWALSIEAESGATDYPLTAAQGSYTLTGQAAGLTADRTIAAAQGSYTLSGQAAGLYRGYTLTAASGTYTLTGQATGLTAQRTIAAAQGSYTLSGQATGLVAARSLTAAQGGYTLTGQDAALRFGYALTAAQGSFTLSGQDAGLTVARILAAAQGSYTLAGQDVTLTYTPLGGYTIVAASGSYTLTGQAAGLTVARLLAAAQGSYTLTGQDAGTYRGYLLTAGQGTYTLTGQASTLLVAWLLAAAQGTYTLTGQAATLNYAGAFTGVATGLFLKLPLLRVRGRNFETVPYLLDEGGAILTDESGVPLISNAQVHRLIVQPPTLKAKERR